MFNNDLYQKYEDGKPVLAGIKANDRIAGDVKEFADKTKKQSSTQGNKQRKNGTCAIAS